MADISQVRSGDVLAFRGEGFISEIIQHVEGGIYSHVAIAYREADSSLSVLEAREFVGVHKIPAAGYLEKFKVDLVRTDVNWTFELETYALQLLGHPYSYIAAVEVGLDLTPPAGALVCSLYDRDILQKAGFSFPRRGMHPQALVDDLLDAGKSISRIASFYGGGEYLSAYTANGERFNANAMTAAHRSLPFGTHLRVTTASGGTCIVRINDRGPAAWTGRVIDLSRGAARACRLNGIGHVKLEKLE
eukprot:gene18398-18667_t